MNTPAERLRWARKEAGYEHAADFARALGIGKSTYGHHENGTRGFKPVSARRYARRLGVPAAWLLAGEGSPNGQGLNESTLLTVLIAAHGVVAHQDIQMPPERLGRACFDLYKQAVERGADSATIKEITESAIVAIVRDLDVDQLPAKQGA